eukprot:1324206-Amphidinium_carterae.1
MVEVAKKTKPVAKKVLKIENMPPDMTEEDSAHHVLTDQKHCSQSMRLRLKLHTLSLKTDELCAACLAA